MKNIFVLCFLITVVTFGRNGINASHLDFLYRDVYVNGNMLGIINIYCEAPDYHVVEAGGEGYTCVDDIARAAVFYVKYFDVKPDSEYLRKTANLCRTIIFLQNKNGWFNNFLLKDNSINTEYKTSIAEPGWWTWRAIWALGVCYEPIKNTYPALADSMLSSVKRTVNVLLPLYKPNNTYKEYKGLATPDWLPFGCAADQAAVLVKALCAYSKIEKNDAVISLIKLMCSGIMKMQVKDKKNPYKGLFRSWENSWHAWGNSQADALIDAYALTGVKNYLTSALAEIDGAQKRMIASGYFNEISFSLSPAGFLKSETKKFSQIAYGIRPMVWACMNAYKHTKLTKYLEQAKELLNWFDGDNPVKAKMYDERTGRCFDGIESASKVNINSGAESTIEALLALCAVQDK